MGMQIKVNHAPPTGQDGANHRRPILAGQPDEKSKDELDHDLDEALQDTFPASDPVSIVSKIRSGRRRRHRENEAEQPSVNRNHKR